MHRIRILDWAGILFVCLSFMAASPSLCRSAEQVNGPPLVTLSVHDVPIGQAAKQIADIVGYEIRLQDIDQGEKVSGIFFNRDVEFVFNLLLQGYNIVTVVDPGRHLVIVRSLGHKYRSSAATVRTGSDIQSHDVVQEETSFGVDQGNSSEILTRFEDDSEFSERFYDPLSGQREEVIESLHATQRTLIEKELNDPDAIDPFTGNTNAQIEALHKQQKNQ